LEKKRKAGRQKKTAVESRSSENQTLGTWGERKRRPYWHAIRVTDLTGEGGGKTTQAQGDEERVISAKVAAQTSKEGSRTWAHRHPRIAYEGRFTYQEKGEKRESQT